jgi:ribosomal protein L19E
MSELIPVDAKSPVLWRVKKATDDSIYGPVEESTLKEWANSAQISPQDLIDVSGDENWRPASEIEFLNMLWIVKLSDDEIYGPTTIGTLHEFVHEGLLTEKTLATHAKTNQSLPIGALFAAMEFEKKRESKRPPKEGKKSTASLAVDMAKDQRIRQLEEDLRELRREHETLTHKFRQLTLQLKQGGQPTPTIVKK